MQSMHALPFKGKYYDPSDLATLRCMIMASVANSINVIYMCTPGSIHNTQEDTADSLP